MLTLKGYIVSLFFNLIMGVLNVYLIIIVGFIFLSKSSFVFPSSTLQENIIGYTILIVFYSIVISINAVIVKKTGIGSLKKYISLSIISFLLPYFLGITFQ